MSIVRATHSRTNYAAYGPTIDAAEWTTDSGTKCSTYWSAFEPAEWTTNESAIDAAIRATHS